MEQLYELNSISYNSVVYKIQSAIPNKVFKIRIDFSKNSSDNKIFIFENNQWILLMEDNFKITFPTTTSSTSSTSGGFTTSNTMNPLNTSMNTSTTNLQRDERVKYYLECVYKLLCM